MDPSPEDEAVFLAQSFEDRQSRSFIAGAGTSGSPDDPFIPLPSASTIRLPSAKKNRQQDQDHQDGPKVDTEGLEELLRGSQDEVDQESLEGKNEINTNQKGSEIHLGKVVEESKISSTANARESASTESKGESLAEGSISKPRRSTRIASSETDKEKERKKRMTVLLDGEMPDGESEEEEEEGDEESSEDGVLEEDIASEDEQELQELEPVELGTALEESEDNNQENALSQDRIGESEAITSSHSNQPTLENSPLPSPSSNHALSPPSKPSEDTTELHPTQLKETSLAEVEEQPSALETGSEDSKGAGAESEEDDSEDGDSGEEESEDEEEDTEPSLKYQRMKGGATDIFAKDTASSLAISERFLALGTHAGMIFILDVEGNLVKGFRSHSASILTLEIDSSSEFVASAGMDGLVSISALSTSEQYVFDFKRPMRCVALEPNFGRRSTRALVCGGMAGNLIHREKSWFGHKETVLHSGEGPIWTVEWKGSLIAWANDRGVRIYDTQAKQRITFISPPSVNPRADLFRCSLFWQDDRTLLIAWADHIKIARIKERKPSNPSSVASVPSLNSSSTSLYVEITAIFELDCMISGIVPYGKDFLVLAYLTEENFDEAAQDHRRKKGSPPELRIISNSGDELSSDVLSLQNYERFQCNDYLLVPSAEAIANGRSVKSGDGSSKRYDSDSNVFYVVSPKDIVIARPRDDKDHVDWLLERKKYEEALVKVEAMGSELASSRGFDSEDIGRKYLSWLVDEENLEKAAKIASKILGRNAQAWEDWIFLFVERGRLGTVIPYVPISDPVLTGMVYDMILAHFLQNDPKTLLTTLKTWPPEIYSTEAVVIAIEDKLERDKTQTQLLMECLAELYIANRQPGKALPYFLRLRRPGVFDLIRDHNLFTAVQDQALLLIEFEQDLSSKQKEAQRVNTVRKSVMGGEIRGSKHGAAIDLLVDHTHSILIHRVISQLDGHPRYLYMYLDSLFDRDPQLASDFSDLQVKLYAEFDSSRLMPYLRAMSSYYSFDKAYLVCKEHDFVPEMVFLLGRVGDNKRALNLIIERLGDVERAIDFAKEQNDDDLWEDLLKYSETKPAFIRGLLENVGAEIDPIRLIRRIKNGLEISGLKPALIKILHDFNLQISLLEGCSAVLYHDSRGLSVSLQQSQTNALYCDNKSVCTSCGESLLSKPSETFSSARQSPHRVLFLCRHAYHLSCLVPNENIPQVKGVATVSDPSGSGLPPVLMTASQAGTRGDGIYGPARRHNEAEIEFEKKLRYEGRLKVVLRRGCPACTREKGMQLEGIIVS